MLYKRGLFNVFMAKEGSESEGSWGFVQKKSEEDQQTKTCILVVATFRTHYTGYFVSSYRIERHPERYHQPESEKLTQ